MADLEALLQKDRLEYWAGVRDAQTFSESRKPPYTSHPYVLGRHHVEAKVIPLRPIAFVHNGAGFIVEYP